WNSAGYSHLHFGLALLPFLLYITHITFEKIEENRNWPLAIAYPVATILAVFTDGYTFMFYAVASSLYIIPITYKHFKNHRKKSFLLLLVHVISFVISYFLYASYIGKLQYPSSNLDFFRGWGVDLSFLLIPSRGTHWIWDTFNLSLIRNDKVYFGDASVWISTFSAPIIILGIISASSIRKNKYR